MSCARTSGHDRRGRRHSIQCVSQSSQDFDRLDILGVAAAAASHDDLYAMDVSTFSGHPGFIGSGDQQFRRERNY